MHAESMAGGEWSGIEARRLSEISSDADLPERKQEEQAGGGGGVRTEV